MSDEFPEKFQTASDPHPHFWKIMLQILYNGEGRIYARRYEGQIVLNACTLFPGIWTIRFGTTILPLLTQDIFVDST